jgi:hypothetical protein
VEVAGVGVGFFCHLPFFFLLLNLCCFNIAPSHILQIKGRDIEEVTIFYFAFIYFCQLVELVELFQNLR